MTEADQQLETWEHSERNKQVICDRLVDVFADCNKILEIGSGTAQHAVWFASQMPHLIWQTSDRLENHGYIKSRLTATKAENVLMPLELDVDQKHWSDERFDGVFSANCIHIMGWDSVVSMFEGIGRILEPKGKVALYGPFKYKGEFTTPSNEQFDIYLKQQNPVSGIRDIEAVDALANSIGLELLHDFDMPANNQLIVWG